MPGIVGMHRVGREDRGRVRRPRGEQSRLHRAVYVDDEPAVRPLRQEPFPIGREDVVVGRRLAGREKLLRRARLVRPRVVHRRREVDDLRPGRLHRGVEALHARPIAPEPFLVERPVDAAVHPVADEHEVGSHHAQHAVEAFRDVGTREGAVGVPFLRQSRHRLTRQTDVDDLGLGSLPLHPGDEVGDPAAVVGDRVAKHGDPPRAQEHLGRHAARPWGVVGDAPRGGGGDQAGGHDRGDERPRRGGASPARTLPRQGRGHRRPAGFNESTHAASPLPLPPMPGPRAGLTAPARRAWLPRGSRRDGSCWRCRACHPPRSASSTRCCPC